MFCVDKPGNDASPLQVSSVHHNPGPSCDAGTEFARKLWSNKTLFFAFRRRRNVYSTVVRTFCKIGKMGANYENYIFLGPWLKRPPCYSLGGGAAT